MVISGPSSLFPDDNPNLRVGEMSLGPYVISSWTGASLTSGTLC
jgi:hypothetical protein